MDLRDDYIRRVVRGRSFADVGGLWGTVNEKVSVAAQAEARSVAMIDISPAGSEFGRYSPSASLLWGSRDASAPHRMCARWSRTGLLRSSRSSTAPASYTIIRIQFIFSRCCDELLCGT